MTTVLIGAGLVLYVHVVDKAADWIHCQPWWDRARPALLSAEATLFAVGLVVALLGGSLATEAVGASLAVAGLWAFLITAVERVA